MKLGIMQPYFFPYIGYWQLMNAVDEYVVYDDVTYIKGGWINRNNFLIGGQKKLFTISLSGAGSYTLIKDIEIKDDFSKFRKMIQMNYSKSPYFTFTMSLIDSAISFPERMLGKFLFNTHKLVAEYLDMKTKLRLSSEFEKNEKLTGKDKVIDICKRAGAGEYYNAIGGMELYDKNEFAAQGIGLHFVKPNLVPYKQFKNDFIPGLSIIDVLMFNPKERVKEMLSDFELV